MLELWTVDDGKPARPREVVQALIRIGRAPVNDIVLSAPHVSAVHGRILLDGAGAPRYEDLRSRNGTFLRRDDVLLAIHERATAQIDLADGDELFFGEPERMTSIRVALREPLSGHAEGPPIDTGSVNVLTELDVTSPDRIQALSASLDREALIALQEFGARIARTRLQTVVLDAFCDIALRLFDKASHVSVFLADAERGGFAPARARARSGEVATVRLSRTLRDAVNRHRHAVTFTIEDPRFDAAESLKQASVQAGICAPLWTGERMAGLAQIDGRGVRRVPFDDHDLEIFAVFANQLAVAVENASLHEHLEETIAHLRGAQSELERLAFTDSLTGLSNRQLLRDRLEQAIKLAARQSRDALLAFIDLDRFKRVNDTFGHDRGDDLLTVVGERLRTALRAQDTVARIGGDEFAAIVFDVSAQAGAAVVADKLLAAIREPMTLAGQSIGVTASIGLTLAPGDGADAPMLLRNADLAMYRAKVLGGDRFHFFTEEMNRETARRLQVESELRAALADGQFVAHFQPIVGVSDARVVALEALVRWRHPTRGLVAPDQFIDVAEQSGIIVPLGEWMLRGACREARRLVDAGIGPLKVAVNLSARQFSEPDLPAMVERALRDTRLEPSLLELEITESMLMEDTEQSSERLARLKRLGLSLCIDDFGTGYSSLAYLKRLPVDALKIDRSFTDGIPLDSSDVEITAAVIAMAHKLKLRVVAEGVTTQAQLEFLRVNGCDDAQGHLFGEAVPVGSLDLSSTTGGRRLQR